MYVSSTCEFHDIRFYDIPRYQGMHEDAAGSTDSEVEVEEEQEDRGTSRRGTSASRLAEAMRKDAQRVVRVKFALRYDGSMCCIPCCSIESSFD